MTPATIYLVDDDPSVREGLALLLSVTGHRVETFASGAALLARAPSGCGCILLDLCLEGHSGLDTLGVLAARGNELPVLMLTAYGDIPTTVQAMRLGARDFLCKSTAPSTLLTAVGQAVDESLAAQQALARRHALVEALATLSSRERQVLYMAAQGLDTRATAQQLAISARTVEVHRSHIARKLRVSTLAELFRLAVSCGLDIYQAVSQPA